MTRKIRSRRKRGEREEEANDVYAVSEKNESETGENVGSEDHRVFVLLMLMMKMMIFVLLVKIAAAADEDDDSRSSVDDAGERGTQKPFVYKCCVADSKTVHEWLSALPLQNQVLTFLQTSGKYCRGETLRSKCGGLNRQNRSVR